MLSRVNIQREIQMRRADGEFIDACRGRPEIMRSLPGAAQLVSPFGQPGLRRQYQVQTDRDPA